MDGEENMLFKDVIFYLDEDTILNLHKNNKIMILGNNQIESMEKFLVILANLFPEQKCKTDIVTNLIGHEEESEESSFSDSSNSKENNSDENNSDENNSVNKHPKEDNSMIVVI